MVRVGDKIKLLCNVHRLPPAGSIVEVISVSEDARILGLICTYPRPSEIASGKRPNWILKEGIDYIIMPRKIYPKRQIHES